MTSRSLHQRAGAELRQRALAYPEASEDFPWGDRVIKVRGKVFVFMGRDDGDAGVGIGVKLPESRDEALTFPFVTPSGYGLGRHGWVHASVPLDVEPPVEILSDWIDESYRAVAPKRLVQELDRRKSD